MGSYLTSRDYVLPIQVQEYAQISSQTDSTKDDATRVAIAEAKSHLVQKYDVDAEFTDTMQWVSTGPAYIAGRQRLTATAWVANTAYIIGALVLQAGNIYQCTTANNDATFTSGNWQLIGANNALTYLANDRVYLTAPVWVTATSYSVNDYVLWTDGNIYKCTTANSDATFTPANWILVGYNQQLYFVPYPQPLFQLESAYQVGDMVYWNGKVYTCVTASMFPDHEAVIQQHLIQNAPYPNSFPDDPTNGAKQWGNGIAYYVPNGTDILNLSYWFQGDNRDAQLVMKLVQIALFHLYQRISPKNVPEHRIIAYQGYHEHARSKTNGEGVIYPVTSAIGWLQACAMGEVTPNLPKLQPKQGMRIRSAGNVKQINSY